MKRYAPFSQVTREALEYGCEALKLSLEKKQIDELMSQYLNLSTFPEVRKTLEALKGRSLAILTNGSPDMIDPLVRNSGLRFDAVLSVDTLRIYKPAPEVYELAVKALGMAKEHIGFVSSNGWDALGAKSFGFAVYWINRSGAPADRLGFRPDKIGATLDEVLL